MSRVSAVVDVVKRVASDFSEKNVSFMAAGIAYNAFVSLAPLLILLLLVVSLVGGGLESRITTIAANSLPGPIADVVNQIFDSSSGTASASVVGLVVLVWGSLKIFRGLDTAFSEIYETVDENSLVDKFVDGAVVLLALVVSIVGTAAVSAAFATLSDTVPYVGYLSPLVLVAGLVVAFFPMYYRFPDTDLTWRDVLPGTVFAAVGWAILQALFQVYLLFSGGGSGSFFGGVIVVVTWLYFSGLVLLLGAALNSVLGGHSSGSPGGVGRGAARDKSDVEDRRELDRTELPDYLRDLRARITGFAEEVEPASEPRQTEYRPLDNVRVEELAGKVERTRPIEPPGDEVEVVERTRDAGERHEREVTLRWQTPDPGTDESPKRRPSSD